jgi:hypothetical protein
MKQQQQKIGKRHGSRERVVGKSNALRSNLTTAQNKK